MISEELAQDCKSSPTEKKLNELLTSCKPLINSLLINLGVPIFYREDAAQECLLAVLKALEIYDSNKAKFVTIVYSFIRFKILDFKKKIPKMEYPIADYDDPHSPRFGTINDLNFYLSKIPKYEAKVILRFLRGGKVTHSDRTIYGRGIKSIRRAINETKEECV